MPLFAEQFFTDHLALPYPEATVVADTYYAQPSPDQPLRLRIDFADTRMHQRYDGLRLETVHLDRGRLDGQCLNFADHGAFAARDQRMGTRPGDGAYGTFTDWHDTETPPWIGIDVTRLRTAIDRYVRMWFPGALSTHTRPRLATQATAAPSTAAAARHR
ncbi:hypothetical protein SLA_7181 [Streptomyces laurentii]|uniref:Uncharacterized protein n=1 Tax=Streptomyces laurentii TaxID=39478 RepID=A0A160P7U8_STRLU|nr:hypothetical protein SLA_7181 [Streptomyces laurentii]